ncbi:DUF6101 family protein [Methylocapsa acidiphila]|uniref:DUF6101 family protein n=1 Tax=Methylocapsa acidiphila TaxID=133552 RepID=UPI0003FC434C|nr:DUF6101 family protein [Methylocapsa acidiphila]
MTQAVLNVGTRDELAARVADDPRADGGRRMVLLGPRSITIKRRLQGMKMHLSVPIESYCGVAVACELRPEGALYRIRLAHRDPELCVILKETRDKPGILDAWRRWAAFYSIPRLVERAAGELEPAGPAKIGPALEPRRPSRRLQTSAKRRARLRLSAPPRATARLVHRREREIICYE